MEATSLLMPRARPKASVVDLNGHLWIAKFPSVRDEHDVGAWELVVQTLAIGAGLRVSESQARRFAHAHHTFLIRRFDRTDAGRRLHFASAMTLTGHKDGQDRYSTEVVLQGFNSALTMLDRAGSGSGGGASTDNGEEALVGAAIMLAGEPSRIVATAVREKLGEIQTKLPPGIRIRPLYDRAHLVNSTIAIAH